MPRRGAGPARPAPGPGTDVVAHPAGQVAGYRAGNSRRGGSRTTPRTEPRPLEGEGGVGDGPPVVGPADDGGVADPGLVDEHLVEQGPTGHLPQRPYLDARLLHVEGEIGDPLVLGHIGVGASQQHAEVGDLAGRGPHLLSGDHPFVAVPLGPGLQSGQVGAGVGLAEELAPRFLAGDDGPDVALLLLGRAVDRDRGGGEQQTEAAGGRQGPELGQGVLHQHDLRPGQPLAVAVERQAGRGPAGSAQPLPPLADREVGIPVRTEPLFYFCHGVRGGLRHGRVSSLRVGSDGTGSDPAMTTRSHLESGAAKPSRLSHRGDTLLR